MCQLSPCLWPRKLEATTTYQLHDALGGQAVAAGGAVRQGRQGDDAHIRRRLLVGQLVVGRRAGHVDVRRALERRLAVALPVHPQLRLKVDGGRWQRRHAARQERLLIARPAAFRECVSQGCRAKKRKP